MHSTTQNNSPIPTTNKPQLKLPKPELNSDNPWSDDTLDREKIAQALTNLVREETNPLVITLNGGWGTGKTFFLERWKMHLKNEGIQAIYFNAWEEDYSEDPLVSIVGQLRDELTDNAYREAVQSIVAATKRIVGRAARNAVKLATVDIVEIEPEDTDTDRSRLFEEYDQARNSRKNLEKALLKLTTKVNEQTQKPLVFIVDELDRCRPTFAIELLERIKHLFGIRNMIFVLGIDRTQLGSSVRSVYGEIDVDGYLRRFFDMEFSLGQVNSGKYCEAMLTRFGMDSYAQVLDEKFAGNSFGNAHQTVGSILPFLCQKLALSLREVETLIRSYVFVMRNRNSVQNNWPVLLSILLVLRLKNYKLYSQFTQGKAGAKHVLDFIEAEYGLIHRELESTENYWANWIAVTIYSCAPQNYLYATETTKELESLKANDGFPQAQYGHLSTRTIRLSIEDRKRFFELQEVEQRQRTMSAASTSRAIENVLSVVEI